MWPAVIWSPTHIHPLKIQTHTHTHIHTQPYLCCAVWLVCFNVFVFVVLSQHCSEVCTHVLTTCCSTFWHQIKINFVIECLQRLNWSRQFYAVTYMSSLHTEDSTILSCSRHWTSEEEVELYRHCGQYEIIMVCSCSAPLYFWADTLLCADILWPILQGVEFHLVTLQKLTAISLAKV